MKLGVLLLNLGTPDQPEPRAVARYLREFLMDPYVVDIPWPARAALVYGVIAPFRAPKSAHAYQAIWDAEHGSPLKHYHLSLCAQVAAKLPEAPVVAAMRYGEPSLSRAFAELKSKQVDEVLLFPLYPQYAYASTVSSIEAAKRFGLRLRVIEDFYVHPEFLAAQEAVGLEALAGQKFDHYLMSFHGVPERQIKKVSGPQCLETSDCCAQITERNRYCYRAQCFATAGAIAQKLNLAPYSVSFQSRLGRTPWIQPYTDFEYERLVKQGVKRLAVFCPSFVADCLETLEEIQIRGREQFRSLGGEELMLIPSLNSHPRWVSAVVQILREHL